MKVDRKEFKKLYNQTAKIAAKHLRVRELLDKMIDTEFGFSFSETDEDLIIDTLDYGTSSLSFEGFLSIMEGHRERFAPENEMSDDEKEYLEGMSEELGRY